jgi:hypothetical protein
VLGPDRVEGTQTTWGLNVCHKSNNDKRRGLNDGNSLTGFLLVELCTKSHCYITYHQQITIRFQKLKEQIRI